MADIRTADVDDLLTVLATLDEPDDVFALLEDLFTADMGVMIISCVSKCLSYGSGGYKRALEILGEEPPVKAS